MENKKMIPLGLHLPSSFWEEFFKEPSMWRIIDVSLKCDIIVNFPNLGDVKLYDHKTNTTYEHKNNNI